MRIDSIKLSLAGEGSVILDNSYLLSCILGTFLYFRYVHLLVQAILQVAGCAMGLVLGLPFLIIIKEPFKEPVHVVCKFT